MKTITEKNTGAVISAGAVSIEQQRAIAEVQTRVQLATMYPRDEIKATNKAVATFSNPKFAQTAFYSFPRGGQTVRGLSIRALETLAICYGNIEFGLNELSRRDGETELEAFAWDLEGNTRATKRCTVRHTRDTRNGKTDLTDERDIYEIGANMGSRRVRALLEAVLPHHYIEEAKEAAEKAMRGDIGLNLADRRRKMAIEFEQKFGVSADILKQIIGRPVADATVSDIEHLICVFNGLKSGGKIQDFIEAPEIEIDEETKSEAKKTTKSKPVQKITKPKPETKPEPEPETEPESEPEPEPEFIEVIDGDSDEDFEIEF